MTATFKMGFRFKVLKQDGSIKDSIRYQTTELEGTSVKQIFKKAKLRLHYELSHPDALECTLASIKFKDIGGFLLESDF